MADFDFELRAGIPRILVEAVPGEPLSVTVPILDSTGAAVPIPSAVGWSVLAQLRTQWASADVLHTFTTTAPANVSITTGLAGAVVLTATAAETAAWQAVWASSPPTAAGDLFVTDNTGVPRCIADLVVALLPRVTHT